VPRRIPGGDRILAEVPWERYPLAPRMSEPSGFDPYRPPAAVEASAPAAPVALPPSGALPDARFRGKVAVTCISIQVFIKYAMAAGAASSYEGFFVVTAAHIVAFVASIISYLVWLHRVAANVRRLNPHSRISPGWAVGSYFVPLANWVVPIISMRDIVRHSFVHGKPGALGSVAVVWWLSFLFFCSSQRYVGTDPVVMGLWLLSITVSWMCVMVLITRISRAQASFRWADLPPSRRPMMTPPGASKTHGGTKPAVNPVAGSDIESGWGR
jgi:hypothetical protein